MNEDFRDLLRALLEAGGRVTHDVAGTKVPFLGRDALVRNKRASGRAKDRADLEALGETP
jgi:hypothetical protein